MACVEAPVDQADCPAKPRFPACFTRRTLYKDDTLPRWWCTMLKAWQALLALERRERTLSVGDRDQHALRARGPGDEELPHWQGDAQVHDRILFSRVDLLYLNSMGSWRHYTHPWHSANADCPDFFWAMSRDVAAVVLTIAEAAASCTPGELCCNRIWWQSWWAWNYALHPEGATNLTYIHGVRGDFNQTRSRKLASVDQTMAWASTAMAATSHAQVPHKTCRGLPHWATREGWLFDSQGRRVFSRRTVMHFEKDRVCSLEAKVVWAPWGEPSMGTHKAGDVPVQQELESCKCSLEGRCPLQLARVASAATHITQARGAGQLASGSAATHQ